jgi:hypothetical protein
MQSKKEEKHQVTKRINKIEAKFEIQFVLVTPSMRSHNGLTSTCVKTVRVCFMLVCYVCVQHHNIKLKLNNNNNS